MSPASTTNWATGRRPRGSSALHACRPRCRRRRRNESCWSLCRHRAETSPRPNRVPRESDNPSRAPVPSARSAESIGRSAENAGTCTVRSPEFGPLLCVPNGRSTPSFSSPTHCTVIVVVGSRCQVRNRAVGSKVAVFAKTGAACKLLANADPVYADPSRIEVDWMKRRRVRSSIEGVLAER